jgi:acyl-coenzyme A thioesterase PaaI-like protein
MDVGDGFARFGGIRVTHVGRDWMIFDWSYQTDPGNPELSIHGGLPVARESGITIKR